MMTRLLLEDRHRPWGNRPGSDRGSLPMVLLLSIVAVAIAALLVPIVIVQMQSTTHNNRRNFQLAAAQAGLYYALGTFGDSVSDLPCTDHPVVGDVPASETLPQKYSVEISYYTQDPAGHDSAWLAANAMVCDVGSGPYDPLDVDASPGWAVVTSTGAIDGDDKFRTLQAIYTMSSGGSISLWTSAPERLCLEATAAPGASLPVAGDPVRVQPCDEDQVNQRWDYRSNSKIQLAGSANLGEPSGLCLAGGTVQACSSSTVLFDSDSSGRLRASTSGCLAAGSYAAGSTVLTQACATGGPNHHGDRQVWIMSAEVRAGAAAGAASTQLVNKQTAWCLTETDSPVSGVNMKAVVSRCDNKSQGNQALSVPATGAAGYLKFVASGRCLATSTSNPHVDGWVTVASCAGTGTTWRQSGAMWLDSSGNCLTVSTESSEGWYQGQPKLVVTPSSDCHSLESQQWKLTNDSSNGGFSQVIEIGEEVS